MIKKEKLQMFDVELSKKYGAKEAIVLQHIIHWIKSNRKHNKNYRCKKYWTFNSAKKLHLVFPYFSEATINRLIRRLESKKAIIVGNYNKNNYDRTLWLTTNEENNGKKIFFNSDMAVKYGINAAIIHNYINYWVAKNEKKEINKNKMSTWMYNSYSQLQKSIPYLSLKQIKKALNILEENNIIVSSYHKNIKWYTTKNLHFVKSINNLEQTLVNADELRKKLTIFRGDLTYDKQYAII